MDIRSAQDVAPVVEHNGTVPVWWCSRSAGAPPIDYTTH